MREGKKDYYFSAAAARVLVRIAVPTLLIHAKDDPFIRILPEIFAKSAANPHITFIETEHGGHRTFLAPGSRESEDPKDANELKSLAVARLLLFLFLDNSESSRLPLPSQVAAWLCSPN
jgi:predicted alpha/beta-fold hydrolase